MRLPLSIGATVYLNVKCGDIVMHQDNDWEHGTGAVECPFENQCIFGDCDDEQSQLLKTTVSGITINEGEVTFWLEDVGLGSPNYSECDIGKTIFLTEQEAQDAIKGNKS